MNSSFGDVDQYFRYCLVWFVSLFKQDPPGGFSSQEKTVSLKKEPRLSLGITIAGGRDCRSRLPVYITSVQPVGCLHRDGTIKRGKRQHLVICDGLWGVVFLASVTTTHQQSKIQTNSGCVSSPASSVIMNSKQWCGRLFSTAVVINHNSVDFVRHISTVKYSCGQPAVSVTSHQFFAAVLLFCDPKKGEEENFNIFSYCTKVSLLTDVFTKTILNHNVDANCLWKWLHLVESTENKVHPWLRKWKIVPHVDLRAHLNCQCPRHLLRFFRRRPVEHQRCRSDPADLQRGCFCAEGSDSSVPGGAPRHPDSVWRLRGGHWVCQQGRPGPFRRTPRRHAQLDASVDSLAGVT